MLFLPENSRVNWTQEFMNKVRKLNEKYLKRKNNVNKQNQKTDLLNVPLQDQGLESQKGDGVDTLVEDPMIVEEDDLLDYEDDLSVEEYDDDNGNQNTVQTEAGTSTNDKVENCARRE